MDTDLVPVATVWDLIEAEILIGRLRAAGIDATIRHESLSVVFGLALDGLGKQEILVRRTDLEAASDVLENAGFDGTP